MPDRSLRLPLPFAYEPSRTQGSTRDGRVGSPLLRDGGGQPSSPPRDSGGAGGSSGAGGASGSGGSSGNGGSSGSGGSADDNPFAPPPEGTPERPWQPRRPKSGQGSDGNGDNGGDGGRDDSPWGSQWSDRQPGRSSDGGFGERPRGQGPEGSGSGGSGGSGGGMRWDPTDPAQRRARYALLSGMWAFFFALFGWQYVALLLGALGLHWAISALRAKPRLADPTAPVPAAAQGAAGGAPASGGAAGAGASNGSGRGSRPQTTAAISGLVTASLALVMVLATFAAQLIYRDYYTCRDDALTTTSRQSCEDLLPKQLRPLLTDRD
ncbi:hypothetical protein [Streptomyces aureoverticillatus]|uniref:hypothetical protein n=1 Tax=Streptomyces aureoverticillatus TaxID=66871 RepID=UPI0013DACEE9|nr:hypothetical protein [Streptomyces aureoverticillatus]QIB44030.1 hypothetical protein G3H79_14010 [Streptomyces aureoverticillatus]